MTYTPTTWTGDLLISARNLAHADGQYDAAKDYLDAHIHDVLYFTKAQADAKFYHLDGGDTVPAGLDADKVDGMHAVDLIGSALPIGSIMVWYDSDANIPTGWVIANGGSGSQDLRDKFIVGAGGAYAVGHTGGELSVTPGAGSVTIATHTLTVDEIPSHRHAYADKHGDATTNWAYDMYNYRTGLTYDSKYTGYEGSGDPHGHTGSSVSITSGAAENRPPYYALYYIQKVV